jgi:hypothetical protein
VEDRPCRQADLCSTRLAIQDISRLYKPCFTMSTSGALESIRPPHFPQVLCTRFFSGKFFLKFKQASGRNTARATLGGEFPSRTLSVVQRVPSSTVDHVSASPPLILYGRISRVQLAATVFPDTLPTITRSLSPCQHTPHDRCVWSSARHYTLGSSHHTTVVFISMPTIYRELLCPFEALPLRKSRSS